MHPILSAGAFMVGALMFLMIKKKKKVSPGPWTRRELFAVWGPFLVSIGTFIMWACLSTLKLSH
jgi:hypothetical protein